MKPAPAKWQVTGLKQGRQKVVCVRAPDWISAVRAAAVFPHNLSSVHGAVLVDVGSRA
jgi:hypothetical protein